ncbi:MAG TPA: hypothetical protein VKB73_15620 [Gaiellaceae bacterium]|nr:hypothetical protein [Gaiellaceae bacterium]
MKAFLVVVATGAVAFSLAGQAGAFNGHRLTAADRRTISESIDVFVNHAVKRQNIGASYDVTAPELLGGMTRKQWAKGDIPAYPFPARGTTHGWTILYVTPDEVAVNLILRPRPGVNMRGILFNVYLRPAHGRWLIDSFMPAATIQTELNSKTPARVTSVRDFSPGAQSGGPRGKPLVSIDYAIIPAAVLALLLFGLGVKFARGALSYRPRRQSLPTFPGSRRT